MCPPLRQWIGIESKNEQVAIALLFQKETNIYFKDEFILNN
jgi:hypothetical protein